MSIPDYCMLPAHNAHLSDLGLVTNQIVLAPEFIFHFETLKYAIKNIKREDSKNYHLVFLIAY